MHEKIFHDSLAHQYISPDINLKKRIVSRSYVFATKSNDNSPLKIAPVYARTLMLNRKLINLVNDRIKRMCGKRDGVLYSSKYSEIK